MADRPEMFGPIRGFSGMADSMEPCKMLRADLCCHGNEIWARRGDPVAYRLVYCVCMLGLTAVDCVLAGDWQPWSECDSRCGYGVQMRVREILVQPRNGGEDCGETIQRRLCEGTHCKLPRSHRGAVSQLKGASVQH